MTIGDYTYKWCRKCRCQATGKQGYFTTHHFTHEHVDKNVSFEAEANHSSMAPLIPLADDAILHDEIPDDEQLVFSGPWYCPVLGADEIIRDVLIECHSESEIANDVPVVWLAAITESGVSEDTSSEEPQAAISVTNDDTTSWTSEFVTMTQGVPNHESSDVTIAVPVPSALPQVTSLLCFDSDYNKICNTTPPLSVIDLECTEYFPCDTSGCMFLGPGGFHCNQCTGGIFNTALFQCNACTVGHGFLGDVCESCGNTLWGTLLLTDCLPSQQLSNYIDPDISFSLDSCNQAHTEYLFDGTKFLPYPSINCAILLDVSTVSPTLPPALTPSTKLNSQSKLTLQSRTLDLDSPPALASSDSFKFPCGSNVGFVHVFVSTLMVTLSALWSAFTSILASLVVSTNRLWSRCISATCFQCFFLSSLFWDTLELFVISPSLTLPHRLRRRPFVRFLPRQWMLLSPFMLLGGGSHLSPMWGTVLPITTTLN